MSREFMSGLSGSLGPACSGGVEPNRVFIEGSVMTDSGWRLPDGTYTNSPYDPVCPTVVEGVPNIWIFGGAVVLGIFALFLMRR